MSLWVLDTDTATLLLHGQSNVCRRVAAHTPDELRLTIITVEELLTG